MRRNARASTLLSGRRRIVAAAATLAAFGGIVTVTQISDAGTESRQRALAKCNSLTAPTTPPGTQNKLSTEQLRANCRDAVLRQVRTNNSTPTPTPTSQGNGNAPGAGLDVLANNCDGSQLEPHDGFQNGDRCVSTQFGEVAAAASNASLLITEAPETVEVNEGFELKVSTRNLIRDRFLAAGQGGYYVESSLLQDGIVRGHFHTACRILQSTTEAPDPAPVPAFFVATEDSQGGRAPDTVTVQVAGLPDDGTAQCAVWAGDGSHRIPMMERANQTPAFDTVRIQVGNSNSNNNNRNNNRNNNGNGNGNGNNVNRSY